MTTALYCGYGVSALASVKLSGNSAIRFAEPGLLHQSVPVGECVSEQISAGGGENIQAGGQRTEIGLVIIQQVRHQVRADDAAVSCLDHVLR